MPYLYRHIRRDNNQVFYVGIGKDNRGYYTRANAVRRRNKYWHQIVSQTGYDVEIILDNVNDSDISIKEKEFILLYGRIDLGTGTLVNLTSGGQGSNGRFITEEYRKKLSDANLGKVVSQETKEKLRLIKTGFKHSEDSKIKCAAASKKRIITDELREKLRIAAIGNQHRLGKPKSAEEKLKLVLANTGKKTSEETKEKLRIFNTGRKHSDATKEKCRDLNQGRKHTPEAKSNMSRAQKGNKKWLGKHHTPFTIEKLKACAKLREEKRKLAKQNNFY